MCEYDKKHHIDLVEAQILRMSENSKQMKTWCFALVTGVVGIYVQTNNWRFLWIGFIAIFLFAWLDAYYLLLEQKFRCVYNDIVGLKNEDEEKVSIPDYGMPIHAYKKGFKKHLKPVLSMSILPFYLIAIIVLAVLLIFNPATEKKDDDIQKIQLVNSSISLETKSPLKMKGVDSVWLKTSTPIETIVKIDDTLLVKNFNKCVKYVSVPCGKE